MYDNKQNSLYAKVPKIDIQQLLHTSYGANNTIPTDTRLSIS